MYHQLTLPGLTDTDTDTRVMKRQRIFQHPNVMAALPDVLIQMLSDYLDAESMTRFLTLSKQLYNVTLPPNIPPLRIRYLREFMTYPRRAFETNGYEILDRAYKDHSLTIDARQAPPILEMLKTDKTLQTLNIRLHPENMQQLVDMLKVNKTLTTIDLNNTNIEDEDAKDLAEALKLSLIHI